MEIQSGFGSDDGPTALGSPRIGESRRPPTQPQPPGPVMSALLRCMLQMYTHIHMDKYLYRYRERKIDR